MKVVNLKQKHVTLPQLLKMAKQENLILKTRDGEEFVLAETDDFDREIALVRKNKALMKLLDERSKDKKRYSLNEVEKKLGLAP